MRYRTGRIALRRGDIDDAYPRGKLLTRRRKSGTVRGRRGTAHDGVRHESSIPLSALQPVQCRQCAVLLAVRREPRGRHRSEWTREILPSCWNELPSCEDERAARQHGAELANRSYPAERLLCHAR